MNDPRNREEAIFEAALELPASQRASYLANACGDDSALRQRIKALLAAHEGDGILDQANTAAPQQTIVLTLPLTEKPGERIGHYKLLQEIGEGGCGVVWMAEQEKPVRRRVALKVIKLGMDTKQVVARFEAERQALALMDHPNIAKVLDAGATDTGRPYFVMELVRGVRITDYCDQNNLSTEQRLALFTQVCQAIQHAHQKGIIHRDIKPSNILVADHDGVPVPKVIDFGIAKATTDQRLTDKTLFTAFEQFIGTPAYMSPEQANLCGLDIDTRTDIYSLGVLLYELLTGKTPFDAKELLQAGLDEMRRTIREKEPSRPSTRLSTMQAGDLTTTAKHRHTDAPKLIHLLRGDLDWIVMKCLEKDRTRRYETANGLALDVQRHLSNELVTARPPNTAYRFQKLVRRNKLAFAAVSAVIGALLLGLGLSTWMFFREKAARQRAESAEQEQGRLRATAEQARVDERNRRVEIGAEMNYLGVQFSMEGKLDAAETTLRKAFGLHRKLLSNEDGNTVMAVGNLAIVLARLSRPEEAAGLIDELLPPGAEERIESYGLFCFRAQYRVHCGHFTEAAADMTQALKLKPDDGVAWLRLATIFIQADDLNGYQQLRLDMLARFGNTKESIFAEATAKTCLLLPWSDANSNLVHQLADQAARELSTNKWAGLAKGLSDYRQGRFDSAVEWEQRALAAADSDATLAVAARSLLAMAQYHLGKFSEAKNALIEAYAIATKQMARLGPLNPFEEDWHNILVAKILLEEAGTLIEIESLIPSDTETLNQIAWQLATSPMAKRRNGKKAVALAEKAALITNRKDPLILDTLAAAHAEVGDYSKAVSVLREAVALAPDAAKPELAVRLQLYDARTPYHGQQIQVQRFTEKYSYHGGYFAKYALQHLDLWKECITNSPEAYYFEELQRDQEFIVLRDASRKFRVQLPVKSGMSKLSMDDGESWRNLYEVLKE